jgi:hypothetical protein
VSAIPRITRALSCMLRITRAPYCTCSIQCSVFSYMSCVRFESCSIRIILALLQHRDRIGHTPMHIFGAPMPRWSQWPREGRLEDKMDVALIPFLRSWQKMSAVFKSYQRMLSSMPGAVGRLLLKKLANLLSIRSFPPYRKAAHFIKCRLAHMQYKKYT